MPDSKTLSAAINPSAVDIIIPTHCVASTLVDCLDSVLAQTFQDWRAIIILNQSGSDASMGIAGKYSGADPRICAVYLQRGDLSSAVNYGVSIASAPWTYASAMRSTTNQTGMTSARQRCCELRAES